MQETLTAEEDVHLGHGVAEAFGSAAQPSGLFIATFLQLFKFGEVLFTILPDGVLGGNSIIPLSSHRFSGGNCSVSFSAKFLAGSSNSGPPVPLADREQIFGRYFQVERRRASARANRGLGLYFCKLAVEAHGGTIHVEERGDLGAVFVVQLPPD